MSSYPTVVMDNKVIGHPLAVLQEENRVYVVASLLARSAGRVEIKRATDSYPSIIIILTTLQNKWGRENCFDRGKFHLGIICHQTVATRRTDKVSQANVLSASCLAPQLTLYTPDHAQFD